MVRGIFFGGGDLSGVERNVWLPIQEYKSLCVAVMRSVPLCLTHRHTDSLWLVILLSQPAELKRLKMFPKEAIESEIQKKTKKSTPILHDTKEITNVRIYLQNEWRSQALFVFTALHGMQTRSSDENSVCPSVCLSVRPSACLSNAWIVTKRKKDLSTFLYHTKDHLA